MSRMQAGGLALGLALFAGVAWADSISPSSFETTLDVGESTTITKTVTVDAGRPTSSLVDVFFLSDTTGSMGGVIDSVRTNASDILTGTSGLGDVQWGVGSYKDFPTPPWGGGGDFPWRLDTAITNDTTAVQNGINTWIASGGADGPESNLHALSTTATDATVGWRTGAAKFVIWFGDAVGHDPDTTPGYPGPNLASTIATLGGENITVIAVNSGNLDGTGQATAITAATGGSLENIAGSPGAGIIDTILDAIDEAFATYSSVDLQPVGNLPGVDVTWTPLFDPAGGPWTREVERTFDFEVTFTGLLPGVHDFTIDALVDGGVVATETDRITVPTIPLPAPVFLLLGGLAGMGLVSRRRRRS